jgi:diacylglycerol kinase (ATP)
VFVIFNPSAGHGRGAKRLRHFLEILKTDLPDFDHALTRGPGDEVRLAEDALAQGYEKIVAVGGDGTWSNVADRIVKSGRTAVSLGLLASGTGNDFGKTLGITYERSREVVRAIAAGTTERIDVGRVGERHFLNVVGFGFDIAVIDDASTFPILKGDALYRFCALRQLFRFPGVPLTISEGNGPGERSDHLMLIVANARYFGGSFHIAPEADLHDGRLDLVSIGNVSPLRRIRLFDQVSRGTHGKAERVGIRRGPRFRIGFEPPIQYEIDGEVHTSAEPSLEIEAVPQALNVLVPGGEPR